MYTILLLIVHLVKCKDGAESSKQCGYTTQAQLLCIKQRNLYSLCVFKRSSYTNQKVKREKELTSLCSYSIFKITGCFHFKKYRYYFFICTGGKVQRCLCRPETIFRVPGAPSRKMNAERVSDNLFLEMHKGRSSSAHQNRG